MKKRKSEIWDTIIELVCVVSSVFGFPFILEFVFGRAELIQWIGAGGGLLTGLFTWMSFYYEKETESRADRLEEELSALKKSRALDFEQLRLKQERVKNKIAAKEQYRDKRSKLYAVYNGMPIHSIFPVPADVSFDESGAPYILGVPKDDLWVSITPSGNKYHRRTCPHIPFGAKQIGLWDAERKYSPCEFCTPPHADFQWYDQYIALKVELARFGYSILFHGNIIYLVSRSSGGKKGEQ